MVKGLKDGDTQINFRISQEDKNRFVAKAKLNGTTISKLLTDFVKTYLADEMPETEQLEQIQQQIAELQDFKKRTEQLLGKLAA